MYQWDIIELQTLNGEWKQAFVSEGLTPKAIGQLQSSWRPLLATAHEPDAHWEWAEFWQRYRKNETHKFFQIECDEELQGLMWLEIESFRSRLPPHEPLAYIHRLSTAPWNRGSARLRRFKPVGMLLLRQAVLTSLETRSCLGRIGLHSLPQAANWYRDKLKMTSFGTDNLHENLEYFEFTRARSLEYLEGS